MKIYKVLLDPLGAECVIDSVSNTTMNYWVQRGQEALEEHLKWDTLEDVPTEHQLHPWYERDDLLGTRGIEFCSSNFLKIIDVSNDEVVCEIPLGEDWIKDNARVINDKPIEPSKDYTPMYCVSWEKGTWEYGTIETEQEFDRSKLEFFLCDINGLLIVNHIKYGDDKISCCDGDTIGKEFTVWFD